MDYKAVFDKIEATCREISEGPGEVAELRGHVVTLANLVADVGAHAVSLSARLDMVESLCKVKGEAS